MIQAAFYCTDSKNNCCSWSIKMCIVRAVAISLVVFSILFFTKVSPFERLTFIGGCFFAAAGGCELAVDALSSALDYYRKTKERDDVLRLKPWLGQMRLQNPGRDGLHMLDLTQVPGLANGRHVYTVYPESAVQSMTGTQFVFYFDRVDNTSLETIKIAVGVGPSKMGLSHQVFDNIRTDHYKRQHQRGLSAVLPPIR